MKKLITRPFISRNSIALKITLFSILFSFTLNAQVFWTENFNNGCASLCHESGYVSVNGAWTMTALAGNIGLTPNEWFVSCAENGHTNGVCGTGCVPASASATLACLHVANISTSPLAAFSCPTGDCGAAYDTGLGAGGDVETDKRAQSPTINCIGHSGITLDFNYIMGGQAGQDYCTIEYSINNGATWNFLANPNVTTLCGGSGLWSAFTFALPASCDNNPAVKIGFRWINDDDGAGADPSFAVDNITLSTVVTNSITTGAITGSPFCACSTLNVPFTSTGTFSAGNNYTAQLSNAAGSFGAPVTIGTLTSTANAGNIVCTIPCGTTSGSGYLIRVVSSNPSVVGSNNGVNITINALQDSTFNYSAPSYCQAGANPTPIINLPGGTFTSTPPGLVFASTTTGQIDVPLSLVGCYNITYTTNGPCPGSMSTNICITAGQTATFSYIGSPYCQNTTDPSPTFNNGGVAGTFTCSPAGLMINFSTGMVSLNSSIPGTYTVTNSVMATGGCPSVSATSTITIIAPPTVTVNSGSICAGGTFNLIANGATTYTWSAGATSTGVNTAMASPVVTTTYTVTGTGAFCSNTAIATVTVNPASVADFNYIGNPYCVSGVNPCPTFTNGGVAGAFTSFPAGLNMVTNSGCVTLALSTPGTYLVTNTVVNGGCPNSVVTDTIRIVATPTPNITSTGSIMPCVGGTVTLTASLNAGGTYLWNTTQTTQSISVTTTGVYTVTESVGGSSCSGTSAPFYLGTSAPVVPLCLVTVDSLSTHNIVVWEKTGIGAEVDSFRIYREVMTNVYSNIASVSNDSLSEYHDYGANPNVTSYKYKLATLDTCGGVSSLSDFHNSIHLQYLGNGNLQWTLYDIENAGNPVNFYIINRDDTNTGNFLPISSTIPGGNSTYTDINYASFPNARYRVDVTWSITCNPTRSISTTQSNIINQTPNSVSQIGFSNFISIAPNPFTEQTTITFSEEQKNCAIKIMNVLGKEIRSINFTGKQCVIEKGEIGNGIYFVQITGENKKLVNRKLIIE